MADAARAKELFVAALDYSGEERSRFLESACGDDAALRAAVEALLAALDEPPVLKPALDEAGSSSSQAGLPTGEGPGSRIGPYKLLQLIGEGGFGAVFMAEQLTPVRRRVALKIIKLGMDTRQVVARFEQERQALAMMDHPHIARVLDAGATETGRPYFVMELVRGDPITAYCDTNNLSPDERLELFMQVCHAVQHAHQKGIIHRDIKPSNILVTVADGRPIPKVIDFGIAKATTAQLTEKTLFTEHRQLIGTPAYMSPEQAEMSGVDIDTRSDIYSLGVLLYELLTGTTPFDAKELSKAGSSEMQRIIREVEPPRPSTRVSTLGSNLPSVAAHRRTEPKKLGALIRGDLDWIVLKCLEKDRTRRYETANGLAMDIRRHLAGDAVNAAPPSAAYRLTKFVRRHRVGVLAGCAVAAVLILGVIGTSTGMIWAVREARNAAAERDKSKCIADFMADMLRGVGPARAQGRDTAMLKEIMDGAAKRIEDGDLKSSPEAEIQLRLTIGDTYRQIAAFDAAEAMLSPALALARATYGEKHPEVAAVLHEQGKLLNDAGKVSDALEKFQAALAIRKKCFIGDSAEVAASLNQTGGCLQFLGKPEQGLPMLQESLAMRQRVFKGDHHDIGEGLNDLALCLQQLGRLTEALPNYQAAVAMWQRVYKGDHPELALGLSNTAYCLQDMGRTSEALSYYDSALAMRRRIYKSDHPDIMQNIHNAAICQLALGRLDEALVNFQAALAMSRKVLPAGHAHIAVCQIGVGETLTRLRRFDEAEPQLIEASRRLIDQPDALDRWQKRLIKAMVELYDGRNAAEPGKGYASRAAEWRLKLAAAEMAKSGELSH
ncbi:MAG TPA: serine/threonine-protein kinase [Phycisphaerae bacterium]|nr:serine/threonine-protein kinase [Phycisphaerae bacterium]